LFARNLGFYLFFSLPNEAPVELASRFFVLGLSINPPSERHGCQPILAAQPGADPRPRDARIGATVRIAATGVGARETHLTANSESYWAIYRIQPRVAIPALRLHHWPHGGWVERAGYFAQL
jgi:hypothetical protein